MLSKFKNLNKWMKIGIGFLAAAIICMIIGLGCLGAKSNGNTFYDTTSKSAGIIDIGYVLKHSSSDIGATGSAATAFNSWKAGAAFAAILTPIFAGFGLISIGYGFIKEKK